MLNLLRLPEDRPRHARIPTARRRRRYAVGSDVLIILPSSRGLRPPAALRLASPTLIGGGLVRCRAQIRPEGLPKTCTGAVCLGRSGPSRIRSAPSSPCSACRLCVAPGGSLTALPLLVTPLDLYWSFY